MSVQVSVERPLAGYVVAGATGRMARGIRRSAIPYAPTVGHRRAIPSEPVVDELRLIEVAGVVAKAMLSGRVTEPGLIGQLETMLSTDVVAWTPTMHATSRAELLAGLCRSDDTLSDLTLTVGAIDAVSAKVFVEWSLSGRFASPCFVDDDMLVEPHGRRVSVAGVLVVSFRADRAAEIRCYYDDLALLEQILTAP